jgi:hypothetical protein
MQLRALLIAFAASGCLIDIHPALPDAVEYCNGVDDDNDSRTLDGSGEPELGMPCDGPDEDLCPSGKITCGPVGIECTGDDATTDDAEVCNELDDDCDGHVDEGFDLSKDKTNCGFCGNACENANGTTTCTNGACVATCTGGAVDCNQNPDDGCEVFRDRNPVCTAPLEMGSIAGDVFAESAEVTGTDEAFVQVAVMEVSSGKIPVTATITLDNPPGTNFDLFVRCTSCGAAVFGQSTNAAGTTEVVQFRNEDDDFVTDSTLLFIEVRFVSATTCGAFWHLKVDGATPVTTPTCN